VKVLLCPLSDGGYLYPAIAVGRELRRRGHGVCALGRASAAPVLAEAGLPFTAAEDLGVRSGFSAARWGATGLAQYLATRRAAAQAGADLLVTSVLCHGALLAAEVLDIPVVVLGLSVYLWDYRAGGDGEPQLGRTRENRTEEMSRYYSGLREQAGLAAGSTRWPLHPLLGEALLLRGDPVMEYPGAMLPDRVHHVGPLAWEPAADPGEVDAVRSHLDRTGKPVVYVHLGRFFDGSSRWPALNAAFAGGGPFQAVVEQGRSTSPEPAPGTDILLVKKPWMGPLIDLAGLVLTSGTSAPVLAALLRGRPLGVCPNGAEQPLLAGACVRLGVARYVLDHCCDDHQALLRAAWQDRETLDRVSVLGRRLASGDSASHAADVIEREFGSGPKVASTRTESARTLATDLAPRH
jgi:UDP:flavonoid glycosyltransferase YjiC (YdhE family)